MSPLCHLLNAHRRESEMARATSEGPCVRRRWKQLHALQMGCCLLLVFLNLAALVFSTRKAIMWTSPSLRYQVLLEEGQVVFGWRPPSWVLQADRFPGVPGIIVSEYGNGPRSIIHSVSWYRRGASRSWNWIEIPLWMIGTGVVFASIAMTLRHRYVISKYRERSQGENKNL